MGILTLFFLDFACQLIGAIPVVAHTTFSKQQMRQVIDQTKPVFQFYASEEILNKFVQDRQDHQFFFDLDTHGSLLEKFDLRPYDFDIVEERASEIAGKDVAMIIFTSGASGQPKGVVLTHANILSNISALAPIVPLPSGSEVLSYLPVSHILERTAMYTYLYLGMSIYVVDDMFNLSSAFQQVRPKFFTAVPRIIERMYDYIEKYRLQRSWWLKSIIGLAIRTASEDFPRTALHKRAMLLFSKYFILGKFRKLLGGRVQGIVVGGAHLRPGLARLVESFGIPIREGYGMTETSPIITINRFDSKGYRLGTVGLPLDNVKVKIAKDASVGEVLVKGPNVTRGYYQRPELTNQLFDGEGWLKTGDIGEMDHDGFLRIVDRKKEIFKTSSGKYVAPAVIEGLIRASTYIHQGLVIGFNRPFVSALIIPDFAELESWCSREQVHWTSPTYMVHNIKVKQKYDDILRDINQQLPKFKRIRKYVLLPKEWTAQNGLLSASLKPMRHLIESEFAKQIHNMYE